MKALCFVDVEAVAVETIDDPIIESPTDAIVKVEVAGLCGSDLHVFHGREVGIDVPTAMGHEFVGEVVDVGSAVKQFQVGDRVCAPFTTSCGGCFYCDQGLTCRCESGELFGWRSNQSGLHGGQAELVRVPLADGTLVKTDGLSDELALLLGDNLTTAAFANELANDNRDAGQRANQVKVVIGCGTVGLISVYLARQMGSQVIAIDLLEHRRELASQLGGRTFAWIEEAQSAVAELTEGRGADSVMELVGLPAAQQLAFELVRPGGTIATIGCHCEPNFAFSPVQAYDKNLTYRTGRCPARHFMDQLKPHALSGKFNELEKLISHRFSIDQGIEAYDIFANRKDNCLKAVLDI